MENKSQMLKGGIFVIILSALVNMCTMIPYFAPSVLMQGMMESLGIGYTLAGMTVTVILGAGGVCMFISSPIQRKLGMWTTLTFSLLCNAVGNLLTAVAPNAGLLMTGRVLLGIGYGLGAVCLNPLISYYFKGKLQNYMVTVNLITNTVGCTLAFKIPVMIWTATGSWNSVFTVCAIFSAIVFVLAIVGGLALKPYEIGKAAPGEQSESLLVALGKSMKFKNFWILMLAGICTNCIAATFTTYLPTILTTERGFSMDLATTVTSLNSLVGIIGTGLAGVLVAQLGRRKLWIWMCTLLAFISVFAITVVPGEAGVLVFAILYGIVGMAVYPPRTTLTIETQSDISVMGAAFSFTNGVAVIFSLVAPKIVTGVSATTGTMTGAFKVLSFVLLVGAIISFVFLDETGPHAKKKQA